MILLWTQVTQECGAELCQAVECSPTNAWPTTLQEQQTVQVSKSLVEVNVNNTYSGNCQSYLINNIQKLLDYTCALSPRNLCLAKPCES